MLNKSKSLNLDIPKSTPKIFTFKQVVLISSLVCILSIIASFLIISNRNSWGILKNMDSNNYEFLKESLKNTIDIKGEDSPTVIEVSNANNLKLQDSLLYTQVEDNDLILVYKDKVIIFRPSVNKIINVFPVNN